MSFPNVEIKYANGSIGSAIASADGLLLLAVSGATAVDKTFQLGQPYSLTKMGDMDALGVTAENNAVLYRMVTEFYKEAPEGTKVFIAGFAAEISMADMLDKGKNNLTNILRSTNGEIRGVVVSKHVVPTPPANLKDDPAPTPAPALDADVEAAMMAGQAFGDWCEATLKAPIFVLVDAIVLNQTADASADVNAFITSLPDLTKDTYNRVGAVLGSSLSKSENQSIGLVAGRIAKVSVQRNIGRVQDGTIQATKLFILDQPVEAADIASVYDKGFISFRCYTGISGYFITDDPLAVAPTDDYRQLARRRVIDKAYRIAYATLVTRLLDEVPVNKNGTIMESYAAALEQIVSNAIAVNMTSAGELSTDPSDTRDKGCSVSVDRTNDVLATSQININLKVRPYGYAKFIDVELGFDVSKN